jgi:hypothetical protein
MSAQTERLREQHRAVVHQVKVALKPGDPRRHELLVRCDELARKILVAERAQAER